MKYLRNNKRTGLKNIRCYPYCQNNKHQNIGFCGSTIDITLSKFTPKDLDSDTKHRISAIFSKSNLRCWGEFCRHDSTSSIHVGDIIKASSILSLERSNNDLYLPWYPGEIVEPLSPDVSQYIVKDWELLTQFRFSSQRKGWHYAWTSNKHSANSYHCFRIYLFSQSQLGSTGEPMMQCIGIFSSPNFRIQSSRRAITNANDAVLEPSEKAEKPSIDQKRCQLSQELLSLNSHSLSDLPQTKADSNKRIDSPNKDVHNEGNIKASKKQKTKDSKQNEDDVTESDSNTNSNGHQTRAKARSIDIMLLRLLSALGQLDAMRSSLKITDSNLSANKIPQSQSLQSLSSFNSNDYKSSSFPDRNMSKSPILPLINSIKSMPGDVTHSIDSYSGPFNDIFDFFADEYGTENFLFNWDANAASADDSTNPSRSVPSTTSPSPFTDPKPESITRSSTPNVLPSPFPNEFRSPSPLPENSKLLFSRASTPEPNANQDASFLSTSSSSQTGLHQLNQSSSSPSKKSNSADSLHKLVKILEVVAKFLIEEDSLSNAIQSIANPQLNSSPEVAYRKFLQVFEENIASCLEKAETSLVDVERLLAHHNKDLESKTKSKSSSHSSNPIKTKGIRKVDIMRGMRPVISTTLTGNSASILAVENTIQDDLDHQKDTQLNISAVVENNAADSNRDMRTAFETLVHAAVYESERTSRSLSSSSVIQNDNELDFSYLFDNSEYIADLQLYRAVVSSEPHHLLQEKDFNPTFVAPHFDPSFRYGNERDPPISGKWIRGDDGTDKMEKLREHRVLPWVTRKFLRSMESLFEIEQPRSGLVRVFLKRKLLSAGILTYFLDGIEREFELKPPIPGDPPLALSKQAWAVGNAIFLRHYYTSDTRLTRIHWMSQGCPNLFSRYIYETYVDGEWKEEIGFDQQSYPEIDEANSPKQNSLTIQQ